MARTTRKRKDFSPREPAPGAPHRTYFKEWRKYRKLSQAKAGERIGLTGQTLARLESGKIEFCARHLQLLADAYSCSREELLMRNPLRGDPEPFWAIWARFKSDDTRRTATAILEAYASTAGE
jgi:transcriptional regulator with XRE-family HTH domain